MKLSNHARRRMRQRGFSDFTLTIMREHGRCEGAPGGAVRVFYGKREYQKTVRELKRAIQMLDKAKYGDAAMGSKTAMGSNLNSLQFQAHEG